MEKEKEMKNLMKKISFLTVLGLMMGSLAFASGTTNIKVILPTSGGPYSVYKQTCSGWESYTSCNKWDLSTVQANSDGTYALKINPGYRRNEVFYFVALSSDATKTFGENRFGTTFVNQTTWTFSADGKTDAISHEVKPTKFYSLTNITTDTAANNITFYDINNNVIGTPITLAPFKRDQVPSLLQIPANAVKFSIADGQNNYNEIIHGGTFNLIPNKSNHIRYYKDKLTWIVK